MDEPKTSPRSPVVPPFPKARKVSNARKQPVHSEPPPTPKTKPALPANRLIACQRCKTKKIKCDGNSPACSACARAKEDCLISDMVTQRVYPRGYIDQLEAKVRDLRRILAMRESESSTTSPRKSTSSSYPTVSPTSVDSQSPGLGPENPSSLSLARLILAAIPFKSATVSLTSLEEAMSKTELKVVDHANAPPKALPSREKAHGLINHYLTTEHLLLPFMLRETLIKRIDRIYEVAYMDEHGGDYSEDPVTAQDMFRAFLLFALATASSSKSAKDQLDSRGYYQSAMQYADTALQLHGMDAIQTFQLVALYSLYQHIGLTLWDATRQCLKICIQEGYHLKPFYNTHCSFENMRRRVFWTTYCMDIFFSRLVLGRPVAIAEMDITIEPIESSSEVDNFRELVDLCRFISRVSHFFLVPPLEAVPSGFNQFMLELVDIRRNLGQTDKSSWHDLIFFLTRLNISRWAITAIHGRVDDLPVDLLWVCLDSALHTIRTGRDLGSAYGFSSTKMHFNIAFQAAITALHCVTVAVGPATGINITDVLHPIDTTVQTGDILLRLSTSVRSCIDHLGRLSQNLEHMSGYMQALNIVFENIIQREKKGLSALQAFQDSEFSKLPTPNEMVPAYSNLNFPTNILNYSSIQYKSAPTPSTNPLTSPTLWSVPMPSPYHLDGGQAIGLENLQTFDPTFAPDFSGFGAAAPDFMKMWMQLDPSLSSGSSSHLSTQDPLSRTGEGQFSGEGGGISPWAMDVDYIDGLSNYRWF